MGCLGLFVGLRVGLGGFCIFAGLMRFGFVQFRQDIGSAGVVMMLAGLHWVRGWWWLVYCGRCWRRVGYGALMWDCA